MVVLLAALPLVYHGFGRVYLAGVAAMAALLVYEHWLVRPDDLSRVNRAFFQVNAVVSIGLLADRRPSDSTADETACPAQRWMQIPHKVEAGRAAVGGRRASCSSRPAVDLHAVGQLADLVPPPQAAERSITTSTRI